MIMNEIVFAGCPQTQPHDSEYLWQGGGIVRKIGMQPVASICFQY